MDEVRLKPGQHLLVVSEKLDFKGKPVPEGDENEDDEVDDYGQLL